MDTPYYNLEEEQIPSDLDKEVLLKMAKRLEPTEEDIKRPMTDEELRELCLKVKCRVEAYRWNPVYVYKRYFEKRNRFANKPPQEQRYLMAKAVNRHKAKMLYDEEEIKKERRQEWILRKKDNILSLESWAYAREHENDNVSRSSQSMELLEVAESPMEEEHLEEEQEDFETPTIVDSEFLISQAESEMSTLDDDANIVKTHINYEALNMSEADQIPFDDDANIVETQLNYEALNMREGDQIPLVNSEELRERGLNKSMCQMFNANTESMTICDSEVLTQDAQSQDVLSNNYEEFDGGVPLTSTQSQDKI
uniref:Telomere-binding protein cav n=1 Tax=Stomoxys calcitrans TaxID=35570 RepID=A0A1I8PYY2_STOCA